MPATAKHPPPSETGALACLLLGLCAWLATLLIGEDHPSARNMVAGAALLLTLAALFAGYRAACRLRLDKQEMEERERRYRSLFESTPAGLALIDGSGRLREWNERLPFVLGAIDTGEVSAAIAARPWQELVDDLSRQVLSRPAGEPHETRIIGCDGAQRWLTLRHWPMPGGRGDWWLQINDVTRREETRIMLRLAQQAYRSMSEAVLITDATTRIVEVNPAFERLTGYRRAEVIGMRPSLLRSDRHSADFFEAMWTQLGKECHWAGEIWNRRSDSSVVPCWMHIDGVKDPKTGEVTHYVGVFSDIAERKVLEERIRYLAHHDPLTGLANRLTLDAVLPQSIAMARRNGLRVALLFVDLDHFKEINDALGHATGDQVLREVARRLTTTVRESDFLARIGGDEFLIVLNEIADSGDALRVANAVLEAMAPPMRLSGGDIRITPSIGIALFPEDGEDPGTLIGCADLAMYRVKSAGRAGFQFHGTPPLH